MNKLTNTLAVAGLAAGSLAACGGESGVEQEAQIIGFGRGEDVSIVEDQWVHHEDADYLPSGTIRNVEEDEEFAGCREVEDDWFWGGEDDLACDLEITLFPCESEEGTHCEAEYDPIYDFDILEESVVRECPAPITRREYKDETIARDEACISTRTDGQRLRQQSRFVIWVSTSNPDYDPENDSNEPRQLTTSHDLSAEEWSTIDRNSSVTVRVNDGRITRVSLD